MANNKIQLADGTILLDLTADTVAAENLLLGYTAHNATGAMITGTCTGGGTGGNYNVISIDNGDGTQDINIVDATGIQASKAVTVTDNGVTNIVPDSGYSAMQAVALTVNVPTGGYTSNDNILANWSFENPVNQRQVTASSTSWKKTIDLWGLGNGTFTLNNDGTITISGTGASNNFLCQRMVNPYVGQTLTASILVTAVTGNALIRLDETDDPYTQSFESQPLVTGLNYVTGVVATANNFKFSIIVDPGVSVTVKAVKLEVGSQQTLAHLESGEWVLNETPSYDRELARCLKLFVAYKTGSGDWSIFSSTRKPPTNASAYQPPMRANPSLSTMTINGTTYYTATAEV